MKLEEELRARLHRAAEQVPVPRIDPRPAMHRGRGRRAWRQGIASLVVLAFASGIVVPLAALLPSRQGAGVRIVPGASTGDALSLGDSVVLDRPPGWTVLVQPPTDRVYGRPVFQLTNFDPGVLGPDPASSWLCSPGPVRLPSDGVMLMVEATGVAQGSEPEWPVALQLADTSSGPCGRGAYTTWRAGRADRLPRLTDDQPVAPPGSQIAFSAFAAVGERASDRDVRELLYAFETMRFDGIQQSPHWNGFDAVDGAPFAVLGTAVTVTEGAPVGMSFPVTMNVSRFPDAPGVPQYCLTNFCLLKHPDGSLYELRDDGQGGTTPADIGNLRVSFGTACPSGRHSLNGFVIDRATSLELRLDDGRTYEIPTYPTPESWQEPYRAFWVELLGDGPGRLVALDAWGNPVASEPYDPGGC
ncbi:MAG: hypothetical protein ACE14W_12030 [Candidatus Velamenicoccus archaeovorus]